MARLQLRDLIDLADSEEHEGATRLQKVFEWRFETTMSIVRWTLGLSASLAVALIVAFLVPNKDGHDVVTGWKLALGPALLILSGSYGFYSLRRVARLSLEFIAALKLYSRFCRLQPFIRRYRGVR